MATGRQAATGVRGALGRFGEDMAVRYLGDQGYAVLDRNWQCGREGELDIVARTPDGACVVAVEVKTRRSLTYGSPLEAITWAKAARLRRLAAAWCRAHGPGTGDVRIDVIGVIVDGSAPPQILHVEGVTG